MITENYTVSRFKYWYDFNSLGKIPTSNDLLNMSGVQLLSNKSSKIIASSTRIFIDRIVCLALTACYFAKVGNVGCHIIKGECSVFKKKIIMDESALHIRYSIVIRRFISCANTAQS